MTAERTKTSEGTLIRVADLYLELNGTCYWLEVTDVPWTGEVVVRLRTTPEPCSDSDWDRQGIGDARWREARPPLHYEDMEYIGTMDHLDDWVYFHRYLEPEEKS